MLKNIKAKELTTDKFTIMNEEKFLSKAIGVFDKNKPDIVIVVDKDSNYKGILSERWIYRSMIDPSKTKIKSLCIDVPKVYEDDTLVEVAKHLLEKNIQVVPIFDRKNNKIIGIIKDIDLLSKVSETDFGNLKIINFATTDLIILSKEYSISKTLAILRDNHISRAPVVENNKIIGIVAMHDVVTRFIVPKIRTQLGAMKGEKIHPLSTPVEKVMSYPVIHVKPKEKVKEAIKLMKENSISDVMILDNGKVIGIVTKRDLLEVFIEHTKEIVRGFLIQFVGEYDYIDKFDMEKIKRNLDKFSSKLERILGRGSIIVHFKIIGPITGENIRYLIRMRLISPGKTYNVNYEGFNALDIMQVILDKMERIIISDKECEEDEEKLKHYFKHKMWL
jgi:predicted transcriptional regulator